MQIYKITTRAIVYRTYIVEAESPDAAQEFMWEEAATDEEQYDETVMWVKDKNGQVVSGNEEVK